MFYWGSISGVSDPITIRQFSGVYKPEDEGFKLPVNLITELFNFGLSYYHAFATRPGYVVIGQIVGSPVLGMGAWKDHTA